MNKQTTGNALLSLTVGILMLAGSPAMAQDDDQGGEGEYYVNPNNEVWVNSEGECWFNPNAPKTQPREKCGDMVEQAAAPEPPTDSDGDGVPDSRDKCPGTPPGTPVNRLGCPQEKQAPVVLKGVHFEFDSATLTQDAENRLDNVVNALQAAEDINVRIEGHTDSIGSAAYNLDLSQRRADSVKTYLVNHGISASRMITRGYGETQPVAPNNEPDGSDNPAGRAKNRRVELEVIDR